MEAPEDAEDKEPEKHTVYYVTDEQQQSQYINMFRSEHMNAVILGQNIDTAFITHLEQQNEDLSFKRIDADLTDTLKEDVSEEDQTALKEREESITEIFRKALTSSVISGEK